MNLLVRILYGYHDETIEIDSLDDIYSSLESLKNKEDYNFIVYKIGLHPKRQILVLESVGQNLKVRFYDETDKDYGVLEITNIQNFKIHLDGFFNEEEDNPTKRFFEKLSEKKREEQSLKYKKWKEIFLKEKRLSRKRKIIGYTVAVFLFPLLIYIGNLIYTGEYKFIGQETTFVKARIYKTGWSHFGKGHFYQKLNFEYSVKSKKYYGYAKIGKRVGVKKVGDYVYLKISEFNPETYLIKGYYKIKKNKN